MTPGGVTHLFDLLLPGLPVCVKPLHLLFHVCLCRCCCRQPPAHLLELLHQVSQGLLVGDSLCLEGLCMCMCSSIKPRHAVNPTAAVMAAKLSCLWFAYL